MICPRSDTGNGGATEELTDGLTPDTGRRNRSSAAAARARGRPGRTGCRAQPRAQGKRTRGAHAGAGRYGHEARLLDESRDHARGLGLEVLAARGGPLERAYGFGIVRQLLESAVASASAECRAELLSGAAVLAAPVLSASAAEPRRGSRRDAGRPARAVLAGRLTCRSARRCCWPSTTSTGPTSLRCASCSIWRGTWTDYPVALVLALRIGESSPEPEGAAGAPGGGHIHR